MVCGSGAWFNLGFACCFLLHPEKYLLCMECVQAAACVAAAISLAFPLAISSLLAVVAPLCHRLDVCNILLEQDNVFTSKWSACMVRKQDRWRESNEVGKESAAHSLPGVAACQKNILYKASHIQKAEQLNGGPSSARPLHDQQHLQGRPGALPVCWKASQTRGST